jgi:hypothetical protein
LSFYSKKESVDRVGGLLTNVCKHLNITSNLSVSAYCHPNDLPQEIRNNRPEYLVLVSDMEEFKDMINLDSQVKLYQNILKSSQSVGNLRNL